MGGEMARALPKTTTLLRPRRARCLSSMPA